MVVAFSGGADSALLAGVAHEELGAGATVVTAVSPSLAGAELDDARALAAEWGLVWTTVETDEMLDAAYLRNDGERCFHCKGALMDALAPLAERLGATVVLGVNIDDLGDHRPGQRPPRRVGRSFPWSTPGWPSATCARLARHLGLRVWDKPAAACLASRVPYGIPVTLTRLRSVEQAESALRALGFAELRVRHEGELARIEVPVDRLAELVDHRVAIVDAVRAAGYRAVTLDLEGLRSGNLNERIADQV